MGFKVAWVSEPSSIEPPLHNILSCLSCNQITWHGPWVPHLLLTIIQLLRNTRLNFHT